jgi:hypothetical protein
MEALLFIKSLKLKGQLPGIVSNTPAAIEVPGHYINTNLTYPVSLTLMVHANDVNERYHYTIAKATGTNEWQMRRAWCSDTNEVVLKEFPVP